MSLRSGFRNRASRSGVAAVEFAFVRRSFWLLILGIIEFGRMLMVQEIVVNATREGVHAAIQPNETDSQVAAVVSNYMQAAGISGYTATLSPTLASGPASGTAGR